MAIVKDGGILEQESGSELMAFVSDPYFVHYIGMLIPLRPGVDKCFQQLEFSHFKPGTNRNDLYHMRIIEWMEITWGIISIPVGDKKLMEEVAGACGLQAVHAIPHVLSTQGISRFPFCNSNTFTLENVSGHPVYQNNPLT